MERKQLARTRNLISELGAYNSRYDHRYERVEEMMIKMGYRFAYYIDEKKGLFEKRDGFMGNVLFSRRQIPKPYERI